MQPEIGWLIGLALVSPFAFYLGRLHKRRHGGRIPLKTQLKRLGIAAAALWLGLLAAIAFADTPKPPPLAGAVRSGSWRVLGKNCLTPGPLCQTHAVITGRHVTLKVAGAHVFEATLAIATPQHKRRNVLNVHVDNEEVESVHLQYGQEPYLLRIPLEGKQTLTPKITLCNPRLS